MGHRQNEGTKFLSWQLTTKPYAPNVRASLQFRGIVDVAVSLSGVGLEMSLSPDDARELAATLVELAALTEHEQEVSETTKREDTAHAS
jgi:hypothetical protein